MLHRGLMEGGGYSELSRAAQASLLADGAYSGGGQHADECRSGEDTSDEQDNGHCDHLLIGSSLNS
jgi:hypothetical protein